MRNAQKKDRHLLNPLAVTSFLQLRASSFYLACFLLTATSLFLYLKGDCSVEYTFSHFTGSQQTQVLFIYSLVSASKRTIYLPKD